MRLKFVWTGLAALSACLATALPAQAQPTTCAVEGTYALTATLLTAPQPAQVGGTVVFTPPDTCSDGASGSATLNIVYTGLNAPNGGYQAVVPYRVEGGSVLIGDGLMVGALTSVIDGIANTVPINGTAGLRIAGMLIRDVVNGVTGPAGPAGAAGPAGDGGQEGAAGTDGAIGPIGPAGAAGVIGPMGPGGAPGLVGPAGPDGAIGPTGPDGVAGVVGPLGPLGVTGAAGPAGPDGPQGSVGLIGPVGGTGLAGITGMTGLPGSAGPAGGIGPIGSIGATGAIGPEGAPGLSGLPGFVGLPGPVGIIGPDGIAGPIGLAGPQGVPGGGLTGYASLSSNTTLPLTFDPVSQPIALPDNQRLAGVTVNGANDTVTFDFAGQYRLSYCVRLASDQVVSSRLMLDTFSLPGSVYSPSALEHEFCRSTIAFASAGSTLSLELFGGLGSTQLLASELIIQKLTP